MAVAAQRGSPLVRVVGASPLSNIMLQNIYAATPKSLIYHLLAEYHRTLCGLYVVGDLHLIAEKPKDCFLCSRCERESSNLEYKELTKEKAA